MEKRLEWMDLHSKRYSFYNHLSKALNEMWLYVGTGARNCRNHTDFSKYASPSHPPSSLIQSTGADNLHARLIRISTPTTKSRTPEHRPVRIPNKANVAKLAPLFASADPTVARRDLEGVSPLELPKERILLGRSKLEPRRSFQLRTLRSIRPEILVKTILPEP